MDVGMNAYFHDHFSLVSKKIFLFSDTVYHNYYDYRVLFHIIKDLQVSNEWEDTLNKEVKREIFPFH